MLPTLGCVLFLFCAGSGPVSDGDRVLEGIYALPVGVDDISTFLIFLPRCPKKRHAEPVPPQLELHLFSSLHNRSEVSTDFIASLD